MPQRMPAALLLTSTAHHPPRPHLPPPHCLPAANQSFTYTAGKLVVRVKGVAAGYANITICRLGGAETASSCANGLDMNCDELVGQKDPTCKAFLLSGSNRLLPQTKLIRRPPRGATLRAATPALVRRSPHSLLAAPATAAMRLLFNSL